MTGLYCPLRGVSRGGVACLTCVTDDLFVVRNLLLRRAFDLIDEGEGGEWEIGNQTKTGHFLHMPGQGPKAL